MFQVFIKLKLVFTELEKEKKSKLTQTVTS